MNIKDQKLALKGLVEKLIKYNITEEYCTHKEHAARAFGSGNHENTSRMSLVKRTFHPYVDLEQKDRRTKSAKYRWKISDFKRDHADLFGQNQHTDLSLIEEMIVAVEDEKEAAKADVQRSKYDIDKIIGQRLGPNEQVYVCYIVVNEDEEPNIKEGSPCDIRSGRKTVAQATVIDYDAKDSCVYVTCNRDLTELSGKFLNMVIDLTWLLQVLIDKLKSKSINQLEAPITSFLNRKVSSAPVNFASQKWTGNLSESQREAYNASLDREVSLIWGPPGTGKSYTLAHVILSLAQVPGKTVVTCISNAALDSLLSSFIDVHKSYLSQYPYTLIDSNFIRLGVSRSKKVLGSKLFYPRDPYLDGLKKRLQEIDDELVETSNKLTIIGLKKKKNEIFDDIKKHNQKRLDKAKVIFTTVAQFSVLSLDRGTDDEKSMQGSLKNKTFYNIVLDEVSMMYPPQFVAVCQAVTKRIIAAGDFRQLGPIHLSATSLALRWLQQDIFEFGEVVTKRGDVINRPYLIQLLDQRRSHRKICDLINDPFYQGSLISKSIVKEPDPIGLTPYANKPIIYVNLEDDRRNRVKRSSKGSRYNPFSGNIVAFLAEWSAKSSNSVSVGVITPYRSQVMRIKRQLKASCSEEVFRRIKVGSIHSFQGDEADVIIYDVVDAPNEKLGLLYQFKTGERLINVALSRAKRKLIVVGDLQNFHDGKGHSNVGTRMLRVTKNIARYSIHIEPILKKYIATL